MPLFKDKTNEIVAKVVYYGPGLAGKATTLKYLHQHAKPHERGDFHQWGHDDDTILDFELFPANIPKVKGFAVRFQLYAIPGQVKSNRTRKFILEGVDALVFVADSQKAAHKANLVSLGNLKENLRANQLSLTDIPLVYAYNKRDLKGGLSVAELNEELNPSDRYPYVETVATKGMGVPRAFEVISNLVLRNLQYQLQHLEDEATPEHEEESALPAIEGVGDEDDTLDFAAALEPMASDVTQPVPLSYADLLVETYYDGEIIFEEGDAGDKMYFIEQGQVNIIAAETRELDVLATYQPGDFFGEMALFGRQIRSSRAVAVGTTNLLPVTRERIASQIHNRPEIADAFLKVLSHRIQNENQTILTLSQQNKALQEQLHKAQSQAASTAAATEDAHQLELAFSDGLDWQALSSALQHIRKQIQNPQKAERLVVQGLAQRGPANMIVTIALPPGLGKDKLRQAVLAQYQKQAALQAAKYQVLGAGLEKALTQARQQALSLPKILQTLGQQQIAAFALAQPSDPKLVGQLRKREELVTLYTVLAQKLAELHRRYIHESDAAQRAKLKVHLKKTEIALTAIAHRLKLG